MAANTYVKNIRRTIMGSLGRYIAILAIIALGVGFFSGVKNTKDSMLDTCDKYVAEHQMHDYRLLSSYGFTEADAEAFGKEAGIAHAEGAFFQDFFSVDRQDHSITLTARSITDEVNQLDLVAGRLPKAADECVADPHFYSEKDIGTKVRITEENTQETKDAFHQQEYEIVGLANTPYFLMKTERGTTSLGDGRITAYIYLPKESFTSEYYSEMFLICKEQGFVYSEEYDANIRAVKTRIENLGEARGQIRYQDTVAEATAEIEKAQQELDDGRAAFEREKAQAYGELRQAKETLDRESSNLATQKQNLAVQKQDLTAQRQQTEEGLAGVQAALEAAQQPGATPEQQAQIPYLQQQAAQLTAALQQIDGGLAQIASGETQISDGEKKLQDGYGEYRTGKGKADRELAEAEQKLTDGEAELADAKKEVAELKQPELFVQTRDDNGGYSTFESNSEIVDGIARVFPVFFFLIAALVCSTTMSRMIEEERVQIGALRALGYTRGRIMWKYMVYSGSAAIIGCVAGFLAGSRYFPYAIWIAYGMMYGFAPVEFHISWPLAGISILVALICSAGTTYTACRGQLKSTPAEILRPRAPKAGKRIFLERIEFLWSHLRFLHKVSARNVFRYKKRMCMMMLGIGGCTALVLTGFGIDDSVAGIADHQYSQIEKYQVAAGFSQEFTPGEQARFEESYGKDIQNMAVFQQLTVNGEKGSTSKSVSLMITDDPDISKAVVFRDMDGEKLAYPGKGEAMINNKLSEMLEVEAGDFMTVNYDDTRTVRLQVSGVFKNYVSNYIYIDSETYQDLMGKAYEPTAAFLTFKEGRDVHRVSEKINGFDHIAAVSINEDTRKGVDDMMVSLNYIITLVIGCAAALAFIVLFNLGNINITEREREIATIKVLGFYLRETGTYVFRENFILVLLGIAVGLPAGVALHRFVMSQIVVDMVAFNHVIEPLSYLLAVVVVLGFALAVDLILRRKLRRINMAEALKSIE